MSKVKWGIKFLFFIALAVICISMLDSRGGKSAVFADGNECASNPAIAGNPWVKVNVFVQIENSSGTVIGYSNNFDFFVTALIPSGSPSVPYLNETIDYLSGGVPQAYPGSTGTQGGYDSYTSSTIDSSDTYAGEHSCPESPDQGGANEQAYDFTDGSNGNIYLNCVNTHLAGDQESAGFAFTPISVSDASAGSFVGVDVYAPNTSASASGSVAYIMPTSSTDLNYSGANTITWIYKENPPPVIATISGYIYAYNGYTTPSGISGVDVQTCDPSLGDDGYISTSSSGYYSFTVSAGTDFCIRAGYDDGSSLPSGYTPFITPNDNSPPYGGPPGATSVCSNSWSYEWQVVNGSGDATYNTSGESGCGGNDWNYGASNSGYDIDIEIPVTISGHVYAYNGSTTEGVNNASINTCYGTVTTNSSGYYSFSLNQGTSYCVRIEDTYEQTTGITPGYNGTTVPPPGATSVCSDNTTYEWQLAETSSSVSNPEASPYCNWSYSSATDSTYNFTVIVTASLSCNAYAQPSTIVVGSKTTIYADVNVSTSQWWFGNTIDSETGNLSGPASLSHSLTQYTPAPSGWNYAYSYTTPVLDTAGLYNVSATITGYPSIATATCSNPASLTVDFEPYIRVYGGDVMAGPLSTSLPACYEVGGSDNDGEISAYNNLSSPDYGSGTNASALASSIISNFVSGQNVLNPPTSNPLTFANDPSTLNGSFGGPGSFCSTTDYYSQAKNMANSPEITTFDNLGTSGGTISGLTLSAGEHDVYISQGPVNITGPITYSVAAGTSVADFPSFELVVDGNDINISSPAVQTLEGTYIAEDGTIDDTGGNIDIYSSSNVTNTLNDDRLIIDGSFIANDIDLYRSYGTLNDDNNSSPTPPAYTNDTAAEEFDYAPINWLTPGDTNTVVVQSITSLPPVL